MAASLGNVKIVEMLLDYHINSRFFKNVRIDNEIDLNVQDQDKMTPLMRALTRDSNKEGQTEIVKLLVSNDCDVNQADEKGNTALIYALQEDRDDIAIFLVLYGADINSKNKAGITSLQFAHTKLRPILNSISDTIAKT